MTLTIADFEDPIAHYAYQCATCNARYIVNIPPREGNGGFVEGFHWRRSPGGADEAKAMALHCCHDNPEPANGATVRWAPSHVVGTPTHVVLGDYAAMGGVDVGAVEDEPVREYREHVVNFVKPGEGEVWGATDPINGRPGSDGYSRRLSVPYDVRHDFDIGRFRLDCMLDESADGRRRDWAHLLDGLRMAVWAGDRTISGWSHPGDDRGDGWTFTPLHCADCEKNIVTASVGDSNDDAPDDRLTFHAYSRAVGGTPVYTVTSRQQLDIELTYRTAHVVPIGFLRVVVIGYEHVTAL